MARNSNLGLFLLTVYVCVCVGEGGWEGGGASLLSEQDLRRHIWGYSVCLCPIKRTPGLYGLTALASQPGSLLSNTTTSLQCCCSSVRSAMRAASQLPGGEPTDVDVAPASAC